MTHLFNLPVEILGHIGSFLDIGSKYKFKRTNQQAEIAFHNDHVEREEIWNMIFKPGYLHQLKAEGIQPALLGDDLRLIKKNPTYLGLIIALVFIRPEGTSRYDAIKPEGYPTGVQNRKRWMKENPQLSAAFLDGRRRIDEDTHKKLLSALRSPTYDEVMDEVRFPGFTLHIGQVTGRTDFLNASWLLNPTANQTLVLKYDGGPSPMSVANARFFCQREVIKIVDKATRRTLVTYFDPDLESA